MNACRRLHWISFFIHAFLIFGLNWLVTVFSVPWKLIDNSHCTIIICYSSFCLPIYSLRRLHSNVYPNKKLKRHLKSGATFSSSCFENQRNLFGCLYCTVASHENMFHPFTSIALNTLEIAFSTNQVCNLVVQIMHSCCVELNDKMSCIKIYEFY